MIFVFVLVVLTSCKTNDGSNINKIIINEPNNTDSSKDNQTENSTEAAKETKNSSELIKTYNEKYNRYNFSYKRSTLSIRKEIFDEYNLTDEHIQKFFNGIEIMYDKLMEFFPKDDDIPEIIKYNAVPEQWGSEPDLYYDYNNIAASANGWATSWTKEIYFKENMFALYLSMIDKGFPYIVCHESGHLFTLFAEPSTPMEWTPKPYVWDTELFAVLATYYLASDFTVLNIDGSKVTNYEFTNPMYNKFFDLVQKYGYETISDTFKEMTLSNINNNEKSSLDLFVQVLSQKTGDNIKSGVAIIENVLYDVTFTGDIFLTSANLKDSDIEQLKLMINLTGLHLANNQISNINELINALMKLENLTSLGLVNKNLISDINIFAKLTNLTQLIILEDNQLNDINALASLKNLTQLTIYNNQISDISILAELTNLTHLFLNNNQINDVSALMKLTNLKFLVLKGNQINADQIAELRKSLPNTEIIADD